MAEGSKSSMTGLGKRAAFKSSPHAESNPASQSGSKPFGDGRKEQPDIKAGSQKAGPKSSGVA